MSSSKGSSGQDMLRSLVTNDAYFPNELNLPQYPARTDIRVQRILGVPPPSIPIESQRQFASVFESMDLRRITNRVLACGLPWKHPSDKANHRNNINDLSSFLNKRYQDNYMIWNLAGDSSQSQYDCELFNNQIVSFNMSKAYQLKLATLFDICRSMHSWLHLDTKNIAIVHCTNGVGRTGIAIACYLRYVKLFEKAEHAFEYFFDRRKKGDKSWMTVSHRRYITYFDNTISLGGFPPNPYPLKLHSILINGIPNYDGNGSCNPGIEIYEAGVLLYSSYPSPKNFDIYKDARTVVYHITPEASSKENLHLSTDIQIRFFHSPQLQTSDFTGRDKNTQVTTMMSFSFNTGFMSSGLIRVGRADTETSYVDINEGKLLSVYGIDLIFSDFKGEDVDYLRPLNYAAQLDKNLSKCMLTLIRQHDVEMKPEGIKVLMECGYSKMISCFALQKTNNNIQKSINYLLSLFKTTESDSVRLIIAPERQSSSNIPKKSSSLSSSREKLNASPPHTLETSFNGPFKNDMNIPIVTNKSPIDSRKNTNSMISNASTSSSMTVSMKRLEELLGTGPYSSNKKTTSHRKFESQGEGKIGRSDSESSLNSNLSRNQQITELEGVLDDLKNRSRSRSVMSDDSNYGSVVPKRTFSSSSSSSSKLNLDKLMIELRSAAEGENDEENTYVNDEEMDGPAAWPETPGNWQGILNPTGIDIKEGQTVVDGAENNTCVVAPPPPPPPPTNLNNPSGLNVKIFKDMFSQENATGKGNGIKSKYTNLLDIRRSNNVSIILSRFTRRGQKIPILIYAICEMDETALNMDDLLSLRSLFPTKEERLMLKSYLDKERQNPTPNKPPLAPAEKFMVQVMKEKDLYPLLCVFLCKLQVQTETEEIQNSLDRMQNVLTGIRNSQKFKTLLRFVLQLGTLEYDDEGKMNKSYRPWMGKEARSLGFKIDGLARLKDVKSADGNWSLMNFLIEMIVAENKDVLTVIEDFPDLKIVKDYDTKELFQNLLSIESTLSKFEAFKYHNPDNQANVTPVIRKSKETLISLREGFKEFEKQWSETALYLGEEVESYTSVMMDPRLNAGTKKPPSYLFSTLDLFFSAFEEAGKEKRIEMGKDEAKMMFKRFSVMQ